MINKRYTKMQYIYIYIYILIIYQNHLFVQCCMLYICLQCCRYFFENGVKAQNEIPPSSIQGHWWLQYRAKIWPIGEKGWKLLVQSWCKENLLWSETQLPNNLRKLCLFSIHSMWFACSLDSLCTSVFSIPGICIVVIQILLATVQFHIWWTS